MFRKIEAVFITIVEEEICMKPKYPLFFNGLPLVHQGKVRDTFEISQELLLLVATDRISTHNVVHQSIIPGKGEILTAMTVFWLREIFEFNGIPHHVVAFGKKIYDYLPKDREYPPDLHLRALVVKKLTMIPFEFIFRARMAGSLWDNFYSKDLPNAYGLDLPKGLALMSPLDPVVFTPTEKSETDDPASAAWVRHYHSKATALAEQVYRLGREYALKLGIDIIDFKAEVGRDGEGNVILGDEWLNGDCCRFIMSKDIVLGKNPPWADKQIFRDNASQQWNGDKNKAPLKFSENIIHQGKEAYYGVFERLTCYSLETFQDVYF